MTSRTTARKAVKFREICLNCGKPQESSNYSCSNCNKNWQQEYRAMDLIMVYNTRQKQNLRRSVDDFEMEHPEGILQYEGLPFNTSGLDNLVKVGLTPLIHLKNISDIYGCKVFAKAEGLNPSGCFKDRETLMCILNSRQRDLKKAVIYSSGNAAASASIFAQKAGFHLITFVAGDTYPEKIEYIRKHGSDVIVIGDETTNFEQGYRIYAGINAMGFFEENGYDDWSVRNPYRVQGDKTTALEIIKQLKGAQVPDYVVVPTANGTCLAGIWKGFKELYELDVINTLPKMVSAGITNANPVCAAVRRKEVTRPVRCDLSRVKPEDASIGSIILAEEGYDSIEAAKSVLESGGMAVEVGSEDLESVLKLFLGEESSIAHKYNLVPEPASLISIAAISKIKEQQQVNPDTLVVSVITGSGVKAREQINELLESKKLQEEVNHLLDKKQEAQYPEAPAPGRIFHVEEDFESVVSAFYKLQKFTGE